MFDLGDYSSKYAEHYGAPSFEPVMVAVRHERVLASLGDVTGLQVLEIGCGLDPLAGHAFGAAHWTIVEPAAAFVAAAREQFEGNREIEVLEGFFEELIPRLSRGYDRVVVSSLLHEVEEPVAFLRALRSVCGNKTRVHVNVPNVRSFHRLLALESGLIDDVFEPSSTERRFQRVTRFDLAKLTDLLEAQGFAVVAAGSYFVKPFTHEQMQLLLESGALDPRVITGLARMIRYMPNHGAEIYVDAVLA